VAAARAYGPEVARLPITGDTLAHGRFSCWRRWARMMSLRRANGAMALMDGPPAPPQPPQPDPMGPSWRMARLWLRRPAIKTLKRWWSRHGALLRLA
jgi:hypothetical protein